MMSNSELSTNIPNKKSLILLDKKEHVLDCLTWIHEFKEKYIIIALSPAAMYELDKNGIPYKLIEEYYDAQELFKMGIDEYSLLENLCSVIDTTIQEFEPEFKGLGIKPALFNFFSLHVIYGAMTIRIFQLMKMMRAENPSNVYVYESHKNPITVSNSSSFYIIFDEKESLYSQLLELVSWNFSIKLLKLPILDIESNKKPKKSFVVYRNKLIDILCKHPLLYDLAFNVKKHRYKGPRVWLNQQLHKKRGSSLLLFGPGYNWDDCYAQLIENGFHPIYRILDNHHYLKKGSTQIPHGLNNAWCKLDADSDFHSEFVFQGIDFFPILKSRLEFLVKQMSSACLLATRENMDYIKKKKIKAVVSAMFSSCIGHSIAQAAHNCKVPTVTWQHGGYGMSTVHPILEYIDFLSSDYHFVYGEGVIDSYRTATKKYGTKTVAIGFSSLEQKIPMTLDSSTPQQEVLYATSSYYGNNMYISHFPFSDNLYWRTQMSIMDILGKHPEKQITVKLHPSTTCTHIMESYALDKGYSNIKFIKNEKSFTNLIQTASVIIIDVPATTILQALMTEKKVFACNVHYHYNNLAKASLAKRAVCSENLTEFTTKIDNYLKDGVYEADVSNKEFIRLYGITSKSGSIRERAVQKLKDIINENNFTK